MFLEKMIKIASLFLTLIVLLGCSTFVPKIPVPLRDLEGLEAFHIRYVCVPSEASSVVKCEGSITKDGSFDCVDEKYLTCKKKEVIDFYGFNSDGIIDLTSYIEYLHDAYNKK